MKLKTQRTIENEFNVSGVGLHTGRKVEFTVKPAKAGEGVRFFDKRNPGAPFVRALASNVLNTVRRTLIGNESFSVSTVEHFLAAASALGIGNLQVWVDGGEAPVLDGSALAWSEFFIKAGVKDLEIPARVLTLERPEVVYEGLSAVIALPSDELRYTFVLDYPNTVIGSQTFSFAPGEGDFIRDVAPARTFGFYDEIKALTESNLAKGCDLSNALVIMENGYSSPLKFSMEPARHKCLDLIGDMFLAGVILSAHIIAIRSGHKLNVKMAGEIEKIGGIINGHS